ncbi:MAG: diacylglycerol kinase family protein [Bacillota bacterium]|nr:diacylglycerol kinase family protein [Bacillota bacterium]
MKAKSLLDSFRYASWGLGYAWLHERNMRVHVATGFTVLFAALILEISTLEFVATSLVTGMVIVAEMANTALEALIDLVIKRRDPLAAVAKNAAAGAVLVTSAAAVLVGVVIFLPRLLRWEQVLGLLAAKPVPLTVGLVLCGLVWVISLAVPLDRKSRR